MNPDDFKYHYNCSVEIKPIYPTFPTPTVRVIDKAGHMSVLPGYPEDWVPAKDKAELERKLVDKGQECRNLRLRNEDLFKGLASKANTIDNLQTAVKNIEYLCFRRLQEISSLKKQLSEANQENVDLKAQVAQLQRRNDNQRKWLQDLLADRNAKLGKEQDLTAALDEVGRQKAWRTNVLAFDHQMLFGQRYA